MDLAQLKKIYFIGIKGVGMTMLAEFLAKKKVKVSGSDIKETFMTDQVLKKAGIQIFENFNPKNIPHDANLIIYSSAYNPENNPEVKTALNSKIKTLSYAEALSKIFNNYYGISVIGSHGKTTTSAWLAFVLEKAGLKPNAMIGAQVPQFGGNSLAGESNYLIAELDEYQNKLKYFNPNAVLLNNIDYDHPDFFPDFKSYTQVFIDFIQKLPPKGFLVANFDDEIVNKIINVGNRHVCSVLGYKISETAVQNIYTAYDLCQINGQEHFKARLGEDSLGNFKINLIGRHNISNALAVIAACIELEIALADIRKYLGEFTGTARRMQILGQYNKAIIIDDYAHHPTEIKATLAAAREKYKTKNLIVVFHPHTFTRTKAFFNDFINSFSAADEVIIIDIYGSAREVQGGISSQDLVKKIKNAKYIPGLAECEEYLRKKINSQDAVILMGAGDIFRVGENLIKN